MTRSIMNRQAIAAAAHPISRAMYLVALGATLGLTGCSTITTAASARHSIPANRLDQSVISCRKEAMAPVPFAALGQVRPTEHVIGGGDTLAVFVFGVFPPTEDETPVQSRTQAVNQLYYPPGGTEIGANTGLPIRVRPDGTVDLPLVDPIQVGGLTITEAVEKIRKVYLDSQVIQAGRERITVGLLTPRVNRVIVLREDTPATNLLVTSPAATVTQVHRGSGQVIDLPAYENDVLHALAATGGLPGTDAMRELWVIRNSQSIDKTFISFESVNSFLASQGPESPEVIKVPLVGCPDSPITFRPEDVVLGDGDVVFVPRRIEYFTIGGLLPGARIPLPRDEDVDVLEAIGLATGAVAGPLGQGGFVLAGGAPGNMKEPTRVIILRKLPDGRQVSIRVDLKRAMHDEKERILIQNEDVVMLQFKPLESAVFGTLNSINFNTFFLR